MIYELILNNGNVIVCYTNNRVEDLLEMLLLHDICVVRENSEVGKTSYIPRKDVSYFRLQDKYNAVTPL